MAKAREKMPMALIARARAAWNKDRGGVLLTGQFLKDDKDGSHYRVLVDGGNKRHGKVQWILARAHGGGYSLDDEGMASAVAAVLGVKCGSGPGEINYDNWGSNWRDVAKANGWTLLDWDAPAGNIALIPGDEVAKKILQEYRDWEEKYGR